MTIKNVILSCLYFCMVVSLVSCSEDEQMYDNNNQVKKSLINDANPFNEIGNLHNRLLHSFGIAAQEELDAFVKNVKVGDTEMSILIDTSLSITKSVLLSEFSIPNDSIVAIINNGINMFNSKAILDEQDTLSETIRMAIKNASNIQELISSISEIESELVSKYNLTQSCRNDLIAITIFKYSLNYWNDAFTDTTNPWFKFVNSTYKNQEIAYISSKGLFRDIWDKIKDAACQVSTWVCSNWQNIASGALMAGLSDYSGARITLFTANPVIIGMTAGVSSIIGGLSGWTGYNIFHNNK